MKEHFLAFVWQHRLYEPSALVTLDGQQIAVLHPGYINEDAGPDFKEARLQINGMEWCGHVELHVKASDWLRHGHQNDRAYDSVLLHVVYQADKIIRRPDGQAIPCIQLKGKIRQGYYQRFHSLQTHINWLPCEGRINTVSTLTRQNTIERMSVQRLEGRVGEMMTRLEQLNGDWLQLCFERLARGMGFNINGFAFEQMARNLTHKVVSKESHDIHNLEALFFGVTRAISQTEDAYCTKLKQDFDYLRAKHKLELLEPGLLKFLRTRPSNFPTIRLAQLAALFSIHPHICQLILEVTSRTEWEDHMELKVSQYWQNHYLPGKETKRKRDHRITSNSLDLLIINVIVPLQFAYGHYLGDDLRKSNALQLLEQIKSENNKFIRRWKDHGIMAHNALESQGLLHLHRHFCREHQCLQCPIGQEIICSDSDRQ